MQTVKMLQILLQKWAPTDWGWCWWAHRSLCQESWGPPHKSSSLQHLRGKALPGTGPHCSGPVDSPSQADYTRVCRLKGEHKHKRSNRCLIWKKGKKKDNSKRKPHSAITSRPNNMHITSSALGPSHFFTHAGYYSALQGIWAWRLWHSLHRPERCAWWACSPLGAWQGLWSAAPSQTCPSDLHIHKESC